MGKMPMPRSLPSPLDPSAAEHFFAVVQHHRLPRRDGALRLIENDRQLIGAVARRGGRLRLVVVADLRLAANGRARRRQRFAEHVELIGDKRLS